MDGSRFDELARALGREASRRGVLRGMASGLAGLLAGGGLFSPRAGRADGREITICHATGNTDAPWQSLTIDQSEFNLYARHGDFLRVECCADSDCDALDGICATGTCENGYCVQLPTAAGTPCDDGRSCTIEAVCDGAFSCTGGVVVVCTETENPCTTSVCSETAQGCVEVSLDDGTSCGTNDACVSHLCVSGACLSGQTSCPVGDQCHVAACDPETGCSLQPLTGSSCQTTGGHSGTCGHDGVCHPVCSATVTCSTDGDCGSGQLCLNGGCFRLCPAFGDCSTECSNCFCTFSPDINPEHQVCADMGFGAGACASNADCPSGTYCNPSLGSAVPGKPNLCTRPCPQPVSM